MLAEGPGLVSTYLLGLTGWASSLTDGCIYIGQSRVQPTTCLSLSYPIQSHLLTSTSSPLPPHPYLLTSTSSPPPPHPYLLTTNPTVSFPYLFIHTLLTVLSLSHQLLPSAF